jgi:glycosyltransferase involved in cell wall biosynthesis
VLVPPEDPAALADAVERLLADPAGAQELGARARMRAAAYDWHSLAGRVLDVYAAALERAPAAAPAVAAA